MKIQRQNGLPSMAASTAPPGQNSIMIWGGRETGVKLNPGIISNKTES